MDRPELRIVTNELWERVQSRLAWTNKVYGRQKRVGVLNRTASSSYLLRRIVKCGICGGNLVITSGRSRRGHRKYGCSQHFYRGVCINGLQIRKEWMEEKLLSGLQEAVLQPQAVKYAVEEVLRLAEKAERNMAHGIRRALEDKRGVKAELNRLIEAVANAGHSTFLLEAIEQREKEPLSINEELQFCDSKPLSLQSADITKFVIDRMAALRQLLYTDITQARAELLTHVAEIRLVPERPATGDSYVAVGEWNLLGSRAEMERARSLSGVRARLVAGACNHPNLLVLPFSLTLIRSVA
jgi:site-specific DNA recombinase